MGKAYQVIKPYYFIATGTILKQNIHGDYFIAMPDDEWIESRIHISTNFYIEGGVVEHKEDTFKELNFDVDKVM